MISPILRTAAFPIAVIAAVACSGDSSTSVTPSAAVTADAAMIASSAVTGDANLMAPSSTSVQGAAFDDDNPAAGCNILVANLIVHWVCRSSLSGGLDANSSLTFYDSTGATQGTFDMLTTASMQIDADVAGSFQRGSWQSDVVRHRHFIVTGMLGIETTRTWNGTGSDTLHRTRVTDSSVTRQYDVTINTSLHDVVMPVHGGGRRPVSGSVTQVIVMSETVGDQAGQVFTFTATYTFDGTTRVPFLIGGHRFHLDLDADAVAEDH